MFEVIFTKERPKNGATRLIPIFQDEKKATRIDCLSDDEGKLLKKAIVQASFGGRIKESITVFGGKTKIILSGLGDCESPLDFQIRGGDLFSLLRSEEQAYIVAADDVMALNLAYGLLLKSYSFDKYKTEKKAEDFAKLEQVFIRADHPEKLTEEFKNYIAVVTGVRYCKDLCNEPANYLTPEVFAADIERLQYLGLDIEILDADKIRTEGLDLIEAVAKGSEKEPKVVTVSWKGNPAQENYDLALVGKGVCFDSGGLSLKSNAGMTDMKMDMFGAAVVVATIKAAALQRCRKNLIGVVGLVENMPSGEAMKVGDIYSSASGKTVEILNTDAEGRLVLADCLSFVQKHFNSKKIISVATLGLAKNMLGNVYAALFANDKNLSRDLQNCGETVGEKLWQLPLDEGYGAMLKSSVADLCNMPADNRTTAAAAAFVEQFIEKGNKWAHIDLSGVRLDGTGLASGFGVRLLNEYIKGLK